MAVWCNGLARLTLNQGVIVRFDKWLFGVSHPVSEKLIKYCRSGQLK